MILKNNHYMFKEHFREEIIETHCVGHFIILMIKRS
jgi:hypothetical protein